MQRIDRVVNALAFAQCGAFAAWQLDAAGIPRTARTRRVAGGWWLAAAPGVWVLPSAPATFDQRLWVAVLAVGPHALVSHEAAAQLHEIRNVVRDRMTLTVPHSGYHRIAGSTVHQISDVLPVHLTEIRGLRVTTVPRTIVDLAALVGPVRLQHIVEDAKYDRLTTYIEIGKCLRSVARRGKPGVRKLTSVLDSFGGGKDLAQSKLERALRDVIKQFGLPDPVAQFRFPGREFVNGCVDYAYPDVKLIIEADGRRWHTRIRDIKRDHERDGDAAEQGWQTLRLLYEDIVGDPEGTARRIRAVLETRRGQLAS